MEGAVVPQDFKFPEGCHGPIARVRGAEAFAVLGEVGHAQAAGDVPHSLIQDLVEVILELLPPLFEAAMSEASRNKVVFIELTKTSALDSSLRHSQPLTSWTPPLRLRSCFGFC